MRHRQPVVLDPRNFRIIVGGSIALVGLFLVVASTLWHAHRSTMHDVADSMTCQTLMQEGLRGNSLVTLIDGFVAESELAQALQSLETFDAKQMLQDAPEGFSTGQSTAGIPLLRVLRKSNPHQSTGVFIRGTRSAVDQVQQQIQSGAGLTGHVGRDELVQGLVSPIRVVTGGRVDLEPLLALPHEGDRQPFVMIPMHIEQHNDTFAAEDEQSSLPINDERFAKYATSQNIVLFCITVSVLGLVIAGSGGPAIWTWLLFPVPALFSIPGFLLRYGRGDQFTRVLYFAIGAGLIYGAHYLTYRDGQIAQPGFNPWLGAGAALLATFGLAAVVGAALNTWRGGIRLTNEQWQDHIMKHGVATDTGITKQIESAATHSGESTITGIRPGITVTRYQDLQVEVSHETQVSQAVQERTAVLEMVDFESPLIIDVIDEPDREQQTIQTGCRNKVLAVAWDDSCGAHLRLISVLDDGQVITTYSKGTPDVHPSRTSTAGINWVASTDDPKRMLTAHLEKAISHAESFATNVASLQPGEWRDVFAYSNAVAADIGHHHGDNGWKIFPATHGRFRLPAQAVEPHSQLTVV